jgi:uncharacterized protein (DUF302 family)
MNGPLVPGLVHVASDLDPREAAAWLVAELEHRSIQLFARIDHAANAARAGLSLRPTELLIFGNAQSGTPLMQLQQTCAIDLPLKVLVWRDDAGQTFLSYNQPSWIAARHGIAAEAEAITSKLTAALEAVTAASSAK